MQKQAEELLAVARRTLHSHHLLSIRNGIVKRTVREVQVLVGSGDSARPAVATRPTDEGHDLWRAA